MEPTLANNVAKQQTMKPDGGMAATEKTLFENLVQSGGVIVGLISLVSVAITGSYVVSGSQENAQAQIDAAEIAAAVERERIAAERLTKICAETFDFFEDADPNSTVPAELRTAHEQIMLQNLKLCTISEGRIDEVIIPDPMVEQNDG